MFKHRISYSETAIDMELDPTVLWSRYMSFLEVGYCDCCLKKTHAMIEWNECLGYTTVVLDQNTNYQALECINIMTSLYEGVCLVMVLINKCERCIKLKKERRMSLDFYKAVYDEVRAYKANYILVDGYRDKITMSWTEMEINPEKETEDYRNCLAEQILCSAYMLNKTLVEIQRSEQEIYSNVVSDVLTQFVVKHVLKYRI